jgi:hypothetical protein
LYGRSFQSNQVLPVQYGLKIREESITGSFLLTVSYPLLCVLRIGLIIWKEAWNGRSTDVVTERQTDLSPHPTVALHPANPTQPNHTHALRCGGTMMPSKYQSALVKQ